MCCVGKKKDMKPNELTVNNTWSIKLLVLVSINGRIINVDPPIDRDKFLCISSQTYSVKDIEYLFNKGYFWRSSYVSIL